MTTEVTHRTIETNGIRIHLAEAGTGPLVLLCHGFPESWYSWRHQLWALAEAGFHAVASDMRGYGRTDRPEAIDQYTLLHLIATWWASSTHSARSRRSSPAMIGAHPSPGTPR
jgi:pimeloyl-ACP methyl ester carboxylesterase